MYKVFINDNPLIITSEYEILTHSNSGTMVIKYTDSKDVDSIIDLLKKSKKPLSIRLVCKNDKKVWKAFKKRFRIVKAAGGIVKNKKGDTLFIFRNKRWDLPKGKMEKDESKREAAVREVEEECGISNVEIVDYADTTWHVYTYKKQPALKPTYWYNMKYDGNEKLTPQLEEGITDLKWVGNNKLDKIVSKTYASLQQLFDDHKILEV